MPSIVNRPWAGSNWPVAEPRHDRAGPLEGRPAVERARLEEDAVTVGRSRPTRRTRHRAVGPDRAALPAAGLGVVRGRAQLPGRPGVATVGGPGEQHGLAAPAVAAAAEPDVADVDVAEVRTGLGVVGPDLLLVAEQRRVLLGHDHRRLPGGLVTARAAGDVVGAGHGDGGGTAEARVSREGRRDVGVVEPLPVGPRELPFAPGTGPKASSGSPLDDQPVLEVVRQGPDRSVGVGHAPGVPGGGSPGARSGWPGSWRHPGGVAAVRRLGPGAPPLVENCTPERRRPA